MRSRALGILLLVVALLAVACGSAAPPATEAEVHDHDSHEHPELPPAAGEGQQTYAMIEGRAGFLRTPLIDVSAARFVDYSEAETGRAFAPVAPEGELLLLFFGYLNCPDVCPTTLFDYGEAFDLLPAEIADRVSLGMISVDGERDDGQEIVAYVLRFMDEGYGLLPAGEDGLVTAADAFGVRYEIEDHENGSLQYAVGHTATVFAIDDTGTIVWEFTYPTPAADISAALIELFEERY